MLPLFKSLTVSGRARMRDGATPGKNTSEPGVSKRINIWRADKKNAQLPIDLGEHILHKRSDISIGRGLLMWKLEST